MNFAICQLSSCFLERIFNYRCMWRVFIIEMYTTQPFFGTLVLLRTLLNGTGTFMYQPHKQKLKEVHIKVFKVCYKFSIILICKHVTIENRHPVITGTKFFFLTSNWKSDTMFHRHTFPMMSPPATEKMTPMTLTTMVFRRTTCGTLTPLR